MACVSLIVGDWVFTVRSNGAVLALAAEDGELQWQVKVGPGHRLTAPISDGKHIFVGASDGVYALDINTGRIIWYFATARKIEAPLQLKHNILYIPTHDHHVYLLNPETGAEMNHFRGNGRITISPLVLPEKGSSNVSVILADATGSLFAARYHQAMAVIESDLSSVDKPLLFRKIVAHFNMAELKSLCYDLLIDIENMNTSKKDAFVRDIIDYFVRRNQLEELVSACEELRPHVPW